MSQISFFKFNKDPLFKTEMAFGGTLMKKARFRTYRPLNRKHPLHVVLRSSQAKGQWSFMAAKNYELIQEILKSKAAKCGVSILELAINRDHIHMLIRFTNRPLYADFIRAVTGLIALRITNQGKKPLKTKFWDYRPFTRIVVGSRSYQIARDYVTLNKLEAMGVIDYQPQRLKSVYRPLLI